MLQTDSLDDLVYSCSLNPQWMYERHPRVPCSTRWMENFISLRCCTCRRTSTHSQYRQMRVEYCGLSGKMKWNLLQLQLRQQKQTGPLIFATIFTWGVIDVEQQRCDCNRCTSLSITVRGLLDNVAVIGLLDNWKVLKAALHLWARLLSGNASLCLRTNYTERNAEWWWKLYAHHSSLLQELKWGSGSQYLDLPANQPADEINQRRSSISCFRPYLLGDANSTLFPTESWNVLNLISS